MQVTLWFATLFPSKTNGSGLPWPLAAEGALSCRKLPGLGPVWKADRGVLLGGTREGSEGGRWAEELPRAVIAAEASAVPQGAPEPGWPFNAVPTRGQGTRCL